MTLGSSNVGSPLLPFPGLTCAPTHFCDPQPQEVVLGDASGMGVTLVSVFPRPAGGRTPGQHGAFVVAVKQERSEGPCAGEKGSQEEEVSHRFTPYRSLPLPS